MTFCLWNKSNFSLTKKTTRYPYIHSLFSTFFITNFFHNFFYYCIIFPNICIIVYMNYPLHYLKISIKTDHLGLFSPILLFYIFNDYRPYILLYSDILYVYNFHIIPLKFTIKLHILLNLHYFYKNICV